MAQFFAVHEVDAISFPNLYLEGDHKGECMIQQAGHPCRANLNTVGGKLKLNPNSGITECGNCPIVTDCV